MWDANLAKLKMRKMKRQENWGGGITVYQRYNFNSTSIVPCIELSYKYERKKIKRKRTNKSMR